MPIKYKLDILSALKEAGYNTNRLRKEKLLSEGVIQALRENKYISLQNISRFANCWIASRGTCWNTSKRPHNCRVSRSR